MLLSILGLGFLLGVRHAFEADHLAAVASLASRTRSLRGTAGVAAIWGLGHSLTLIVLGGIVIALGMVIPGRLGMALESAAGVMLIVLGIGLLREVAGGQHRLEPAHGTHDHDEAHAAAHRLGHPHVHRPDLHAHILLPKALLVGSVHGLAGTGALVLLSVQALRSGLQAFGYLAVVAVGSILGMILFSVAFFVPMGLSRRWLQQGSAAFDVLIGIGNIGIGGWVIAQAIR